MSTVADETAGGAGAASGTAAAATGTAAPAAALAPGVAGGGALTVDATEGGAKPSLYMILFNIGKKTNVGNVIRSASAFGATACVVVGNRKVAFFGSHGSDRHVPLLHFGTLAEAVAHLHDRGVRIVGVEIVEGARPVQSHPFEGSTAIMMGNEGTGLSSTQKAVCDSFVYIPQYGGGTASLNVTVAASIVLHHFALWAGYSERRRDPEHPEKYLVAEVPHRAPGERHAEDDVVADARARERAEMEEAAEGVEGAGGDLFGESDGDGDA